MTMKNLGNIIVATALTLPVVAATADKQAIEALVKRTPISPQNAERGIEKLIKSGFLKPIKSDGTRHRNRILRDRPARSQENTSQQGRSRQHVRQHQNPRTTPRSSARQKPQTVQDTSRHEPSDDWYDDYFIYYDDGGILPGYDDYVRQDDYYYDDLYGSMGKGGTDDNYYYDDYYYGKGSKSTKGSKSSKGSKKGGKGKGKGGKGTSKGGGKGKGGSGGYYDDLFYVDDTIIGGDDLIIGGDDTIGGGEVGGEIIYLVEGFIDAREVGPPIYANPNSPNEFAAGNVNLYADTPLWSLDGIGASALIGLVQGTCTRTDPNNANTAAYEGHGVCTWTFEALSGSEVVASFTAEGTVQNPSDFQSSVLTIKGGLGQFAGISGEVYLDTAVLDTSTSPPQALFDPSADFLSDPDGYLMLAYIYSDVRIDLLGDDFVTDDVFIDDTVFVDDAVTDDPIVDDMFIDDAFLDDTISTLEPSETAFPSSLTTGTDAPTLADTSLGTVDSTMALRSVLCPNLPTDEFCDCDGDCFVFPDSRCACEDALNCCSMGST